jgi:hypothetical protein
MFSMFRVFRMSVWFSHWSILFMEGRSRSWLYVRMSAGAGMSCFRLVGLLCGR